MLSTVARFAALLAVASHLTGCGGDRSKDAARKLQIAVIPKGTSHEFWKSIHAGAVKAARELGGVEIIWKGPEREDDAAAQRKTVEDFVSSRIDGIVLAPLSEEGLVRPVEQAKREKIPVVIVDSGLKGEDYLTYIATDNYKGGCEGARRLAAVVGGRGKVAMLRMAVGHESTTQRENGFKDTMEKEFKNIQLVNDRIFGGVTRTESKAKALDLLDVVGEVDGIFCPNENTVYGMMLALQEKKQLGKIKLVGFDAGPELTAALGKGEIQGLVLQNPMKMGYLGVKRVVEHIRGVGGRPARYEDTGLIVATPENMNRPEVKDLLSPDLSEWLGT
jgi:ribose transport system substrate-binding protein